MWSLFSFRRNKDYVQVELDEASTFHDNETTESEEDIEESTPLAIDERTMERIESTGLIDSQDNSETATTVLGFTQAFSPVWWFSTTGSEYTHIIFWILKDLSWTQGWQFFALFSGSLSLLWVLVILYHALRTENRDEIYNAIALFLW